MQLALSFDDVLIAPTFSTLQSRQDVDPSVTVADTKLSLGVISSNMDSVTDSAMANAMRNYGALGCLHRFWTIEKNLRAFRDCHKDTWCSVGVSRSDLERAEALHRIGCNIFVLDVAHGASMQVVDQVNALKNLLPNVELVVGNFAVRKEVEDFFSILGSGKTKTLKIGVGGGSACITRTVTGCGIPTLASLLDIAPLGYDVISDGGCRTSGDIFKAFAAGARAVFLGGMLAGAEETPVEAVDKDGTIISGYMKEHFIQKGHAFKKYRGSASLESYQTQGKEASYRAPEGESFIVPYTGPVRSTLERINGGVRSGMSYISAHTFDQIKENAKFVQVTSNGMLESKAHGKK